MHVRLVDGDALGALNQEVGEATAWVAESVAGVADLVVLLPPYEHSLAEIIPLGRVSDHSAWSRSVGSTAIKRVRAVLAKTQLGDDPPFALLPTYAATPNKVLAFCPLGAGCDFAERLVKRYLSLAETACHAGATWTGQPGDHIAASLSSHLVDFALRNKAKSIEYLSKASERIIDLGTGLVELPLRTRLHLSIADSLLSHGTRPGQDVGFVGEIDALNLARAEFLARVASPLFIVRWRELRKAIDNPSTKYADDVTPERMRECAREYVEHIRRYLPQLEITPGIAEVAR